ncbi:hypothetical protein BDP55DRAFT_420068 [Colletotrichum godetiae]|uniref:Uncharacterized protein n=1 Tax=Colletotrichum godetiae TaxID=1209918 RepID=A0AAJ0ENM9_9PEZI|nr:uncharacterized protein BDP55DRAFT_420068 [Colletotrichum godetiae]KAK1657752.1 hypothetical protein BDP55DRAFT_420068 [Colletotrichum godetiae]
MDLAQFLYLEAEQPSKVLIQSAVVQEPENWAAEEPIVRCPKSEIHEQIFEHFKKEHGISIAYKIGPASIKSIEQKGPFILRTLQPTQHVHVSTPADAVNVHTATTIKNTSSGSRGCSY